MFVREPIFHIDLAFELTTEAVRQHNHSPNMPTNLDNV